jgi:hypothetical protein
MGTAEKLAWFIVQINPKEISKKRYRVAVKLQIPTRIPGKRDLPGFRGWSATCRPAGEADRGDVDVCRR